MSRTVAFGIVGGYGATGRVVVSELWKSCEGKILIGGRDLAKGTALAEELGNRVSAAHLDVLDGRSLDDFCSQCSIIVNCAGPVMVLQDRVAQAAFRRNCHYIDVAGLTFVKERMLPLPEYISEKPSAGGWICGGSNVAVPPQILIQMIQAEAGGTNATTITAVAEVVKNRFTSSIFNPPYSTYQNAIPGQVVTTTTSNGIEPEFDIAASVFTGNSAGIFCSSLAFWTPTSSQWNIVQNALMSGTTTFPSGIEAPTYDPSKWPTSSQQILFVPSVGSNSSGIPYFLFLAQRGSTQAAAVNASCN